MKSFESRLWLNVVSVLWAICASDMPSTAHAQDINAGKLVYTTPQVTGQLSCSAGACHTPNPLINQNKILKAADNPGAIGVALNSVIQMAFLKGVMVTQQFIDLAAYIGNPAAAGSPAAQVSPTALAFPATPVGASASSQQFAIDNTGTAALIVTSVTSSNAEFSLISGCGTIAAGASCNVSVGFNPTTAGTRSGTITVNHNASGAASSVTVSGTATVPAVPDIRVTPSSLSFGAIVVGSLSAAQTITINSVGTAPLIITALSDPGAAFPLVGGTCVVGAPIGPGTSCTLLLRFAPTTISTLVRTIAISDNVNATPVSVSLSGTAVASVSTTKTMVEYLYSPLNYYFITSRDDDKTALDSRADFNRTGFSFSVYATEFAGTKALSRFYFDQIAVHASRGSHFYTLLDSDKAALIALNPGNAATPRLPVNEGVDSWAFLPLVSGPGGRCASGQIPVYRLFRGGIRFPDDPNHRFTASLATYDAFVALGWDGEGVNFCVPQP